MKSLFKKQLAPPGAKSLDLIKTKDELFAFLAGELPSQNQLSSWLERMRLEQVSDFVGITTSLKVEISQFSPASAEFRVAEEAIKRVEAGEPDYQSWTDSQRGPDRGFAG